MRVLVLGDMEGSTGITVWHQTFEYNFPQLYQEGRRLYTEDANAAVRGAFKAGADQVIIYDHHGTPEPYRNNSMIPELLHPDCEFVAHDYGLPGLFLEQGFDAAILIGQHARAGTVDGLLSHTHTREIRNMWFNERLAGEIDTYSAHCGEHGIPVVCVVGDAAACRQAKESLGDELVTVAVKKGLSRNSAQCLSPRKSWELIEAAAEHALRTVKIKPYVPASPVTLKIQLYEEDKSFGFYTRPEVEQLPDFTFATQAPTVSQARLKMYGDVRDRILSPYIYGV